MAIVSYENFEAIRQGTITYEEFNKLVEELISLSVERSLQSLPSVVDYMVRQTTYLKQLSESFYKENEDLASHRDQVTRVIERLESENPGKSYEDLLEMAATRTRDIIGGSKKVDMYSNFDLSKADEDLGQI